MVASSNTFRRLLLPKIFNAPFSFTAQTVCCMPSRPHSSHSRSASKYFFVFFFYYRRWLVTCLGSWVGNNSLKNYSVLTYGRSNPLSVEMSIDCCVHIRHTRLQLFRRNNVHVRSGIERLIKTWMSTHAVHCVCRALFLCFVNYPVQPKNGKTPNEFVALHGVFVSHFHHRLMCQFDRMNDCEIRRESAAVLILRQLHSIWQRCRHRSGTEIVSK